MRTAGAALALALVCCAQQGRKGGVKELAVDVFKSEIGYTEQPAGVDPASGVVCDWPAAAGLPGLGDWQVVYDNSRPQADAGVRKIDLHREFQELSLEIYVAASGAAAARRHLLETATNTMRVDVPYRRGPGDLGDLSAVSLEQDPSAVIWTRRNVFFSVRKTASRAALAPIAYVLDGLARSREVPRLAEHLPRLAGVRVTPQRVQTGEKLTVEIQPEAGADASRYEAAFELKGRQLRAGPRRGLTLQFTGAEPGEAEVVLHVMDRHNLLTRSATARAEVVAAR